MLFMSNWSRHVKTLHSHCFNPINHVWMTVDAMHLLFLQAAPEKDNIHDHNKSATEQINFFACKYSNIQHKQQFPPPRRD